MTAPFFPRLASPDAAPALRCAGRSMSYRVLARAAADVAACVEPGSRVAIWAEPALETCVAAVGALAGGAAIVPLSPASGSAELEHIRADAGPVAILARAEVELPQLLAGIPRIAPALDGPDRPLPDLLEPESVALILYTSGTTGLPKGVQLPRRAVETNLDALAQVWDWTPADALVHALPLFHVHGLVLGVLGPLRAAASLELVPRFDVDEIAAALGRGGTMLFGVPTMYHRIAAALESRPELAAPFRNARLVVSGSAGLPKVDHVRFERLTGQRIVERYGMTETLMNLAVSPRGVIAAGYVGVAVPGVDVRLVDEAGATIDPRDDETFGEVEVRGPNLFVGYLNQPEATEAAFRDGWFRTGDLATTTADGRYRIVGRRATDLIKSGGYRIGAGEIEGALLEHPGVGECAVAGVADDDLGERIVAWVVAAPGAAPSGDELRRHVGSLLSSYKRPHEVRLVDELPRNALGKVTKRRLVETLA